MPTERTVSLPEGRTVTVVADDEDVSRIARAWPLGVVRYRGGAGFGLVIAQAPKLAWGLKLQHPDLDPETAATVRMLLLLGSAAAAKAIASDVGEGILLPMVYHKPKSAEAIEVGTVLLGHAPGLSSSEETEKWIWTHVQGFQVAMLRALEAWQLPAPPPIIGFDWRPANALGKLTSEIAVVDGELLLLAHEDPPGEHPLWQALGYPETIRRVPISPLDVDALAAAMRAAGREDEMK